MTRQKVPMKLYQRVQSAAENIYRYDRIERYVLNQIILAAENRQQIDPVFITCAEKFLQQHHSDKPKVAA